MSCREPTFPRAYFLLALILLVFGHIVPTVHAHPIPFSYLDIRINDDQIEGTLVAHIVDLAHDLDVTSPDTLLNPQFAASKKAEIEEIIRAQLLLSADGLPIASELSGVIPLPDRQALSCELRFKTISRPSALRIQCGLFLFDTEHQTFLNVYDRDNLVHQEILTQEHQTYVYRVGARQDWFSVVKEFTPAGIYHIFTGPDHVLFIIGLLLLGGSVLRLLSIVTAFTIAHSITLTLAALDLVNPSPKLIEPAIALSIVYVGIDNLMLGNKSRDLRAWVAFFFGFVHGFGFAGVLKEFGLPRQALGWSLFSFNFGVEIGQACIVLLVASLLAVVKNRNQRISRAILIYGSIFVILAGGYWFIERLFFAN